MADRRKPHVASGDVQQRRRSKVSDDREDTRRPGGQSRVRTRNRSGDSSSAHRRSADERYQDDGHLGSLRSPLRLDTDRMGRVRGSRSDQQRSSFPTEHRQRRSAQLKSDRAEDDRVATSSNSWQLDSLSDFPMLQNCQQTACDWGTMVEHEERARASRFKCQLYSHEAANKNSDSGCKRQFTAQELATDEVQVVLGRREKQLDYGKNTACYAKYLRDVPREQRTKVHPSTPNKHMNYTRRGWDMLIKIWRKKLHYWDPEGEADATKAPSDDLTSDCAAAAGPTVADGDQDADVDLYPDSDDEL